MQKILKKIEENTEEKLLDLKFENIIQYSL